MAKLETVIQKEWLLSSFDRSVEYSEYLKNGKYLHKYGKSLHPRIKLCKYQTMNTICKSCEMNTLEAENFPKFVPKAAWRSWSWRGIEQLLHLYRNFRTQWLRKDFVYRHIAMIFNHHHHCHDLQVLPYCHDIQGSPALPWLSKSKHLAISTRYACLPSALTARPQGRRSLVPWLPYVDHNDNWSSRFRPFDQGLEQDLSTVERRRPSL